MGPVWWTQCYTWIPGGPCGWSGALAGQEHGGGGERVLSYKGRLYTVSGYDGGRLVWDTTILVCYN